MKLAVVGSRGFKNLSLVDEYLTKMLWREFEQIDGDYESESFNEVKDHLLIITGGAEGVDKTAEDWCKRNLHHYWDVNRKSNIDIPRLVVENWNG